jgi:putative ABC transport system substrate-binding protein
MNRRVFIGAFGCATLSRALAALAQQPKKVARIGFLAPGSAATVAGFLDELKAELRDQGYADAVIEPALGGTRDALQQAAAELVRSKVDMIIAWSTPAVIAAKRATGAIPIVMVGTADPIGAGLVESLAHPGGNVTGTTNLARDLSGKILDLMLQIMPGARRLGILLNPSNEAAALQLRDTEVAAHALGLELHIAHAVTADDLARAVERLVGQGASALVVLPDPLFAAERVGLADLALANRLPTACSRRENAEAGALFSYGPNLRGQFRRAAVYAAKILGGSRPTDLPVEQPTRLEFVVNLKTAAALGVSMPPSLLARADEVIE